MAKNVYQKPSLETQTEALKIAKATQRPAQTKKETKLIAQGIEKGIALYKKQQKERARELNRKLKRASSQPQHFAESEDQETLERIVFRQHWLPWLLLGLSWLGWAVYFFVSRGS